MFERALLLIAVALALFIVVVGARVLARGRLAQLRSGDQARVWSALGAAPDGRPSLIVFSTPGCSACRTAQYPAVQAVASRFGQRLRVMNVDIADRPAVGRAFNVLTAPTTVVMDGDGRIEHFNHGFAPAEVLSAQLSALGASPA